MLSNQSSEKKPFVFSYNALNIVIGLLVLIGGVVLIIVIRGVFKSSSGMDPNAIGDAVGGLTAPFINLIAAILVYQSFMAQKQANDQIRDELKQNESDASFRLIDKSIDRISDALDQFSFIHSDRNGLHALVQYGYWFGGMDFKYEFHRATTEAFGRHAAAFDMLYAIIYWFDYADNKIDQDTLLSDKDREYFNVRLMVMYEAFLKDCVQAISSKYIEVRNPLKSESNVYWKKMKLIHQVHSKYTSKVD